MTVSGAPTDEAPGGPHVELTWHLCDAVTGRVLADLPLAQDEPIKRKLAMVETAALRLNVTDPDCPPDWRDLLTLGRSIIVLTVDGQPTQSWFAEVDAVGDVTVPITCQTLERVLERTNVPDLDASDLDDAEALAQLCEPLVEGWGFGIEVTPVGKKTGKLYVATEDLNLLTAANELMSGAGGPEWRIALDWADDTHRAVTKTIQAGPRVGRDRPDVVFDRDASGDGVIESYLRTTSYAPGMGGTRWTGVSEGSGESRPMSPTLTSALVAQGWPVIEERPTFTGLGEGSIADEDAELLSRTETAMAAKERGTVTWTIVGTDAAPMPGRDYEAGDTVHIDVAPNPPIDPLGGQAAVRVIGWELDPLSGQTTPILFEDGASG